MVFRARPDPELLPRRASTRQRGKSAASIEAATAAALAQALAEEQRPIEPPRNLPAIGEALKSVGGGGAPRADWFASQAHLLESGGAALFTGHSHKVYSTAVEPGSGLLAAAGEKGLVSFWRGGMAPRSEATSTEASEGHGVQLSVKAHVGWVAEIQFVAVPAIAGDTLKTLLLSASNDKCIVLSSLSIPRLGVGGELRPVSRLTDVHSNGIFSVHEQHSEVVSCSKDGTVGLAAIRESQLSANHTSICRFHRSVARMFALASRESKASRTCRLIPPIRICDRPYDRHFEKSGLRI